MIIDVSKLLLNMEDELVIKDDVNIPIEYLDNCNIRKLESVKFDGTIVKLVDDRLELDGVITGVMILPDDTTLEDVSYSFNIKIEEKLENFTNSLDITDILWQNILVEIPLKVKSEKSENLTLKGDGWRLVTEEELKEGNNSPFSELSKIFDSRKE